jgi:hypothetical protein
MDDPRTVSKATFGCLKISLMILFALAANVAVICLSRAWDVRFQPSWMGGLTMLYMVLSHIAADKTLKLLGLSRSGRVVEVRSRSPFDSDDDAPLDDIAEARLSSGMITFLLIGLPVMGLFLLASPLFMGEEEGVIRWLGLGMGAFFLVCFVHVLWDRKNPQARADAEGVTGYPSPRAVRRMFVPWSDVLTCEIQTIYDTFGKPVLLRPILRGHNGETLMELNLLQTPIAEQERVVKFIKARLPKTHVDPWEV